MDKILCFLAKYQPLVDFLVSTIPIVITIFGIYIATQQYQTNRKKLKLDLFNKRFRVFQSTKEFIAKVVQKRKASIEEQQAYLLETRGTEFLFNTEIKSYIDEIWDKSVNLESWSEDESTSSHANERSAHMKWFNNELSSIDKKFKPFMQLGH